MTRTLNPGLKFPAKWTNGELINPISGILNGVWEQPRLAGYADLFQYAAMACDTSAFGGPDNFRHVGGASLDRDGAWIKAVGEGIERYCAAIYEPTDYLMCTRADASFDIVDLSLLSLYPREITDTDDFPFDAVDDTALIRWCPAQTLDGVETHVPCAGVFVPWYYELATGETPLFQPISTGLACHSSEAAARLGGLMEVVERDAFTTLWQTCTPLTEIATDALPADSSEILRRITATGASVRIGFVPTDHGIPVCIAAQSIDSGRMPAFSLAASAGAAPADAVRKALEELVHTFRWMARLNFSRRDFTPDAEFSNVVDQETHLLLWCDIANRHRTEFLWSGEKVAYETITGIDGDTPEAQLQDANARVKATGYTPLFVKLTTQDVADFGFHVTRALVPGYNPLFMGHNLRSRTNPRLLKRLAKMQETKPDAALNDYPHPFP